MEEFDMFIGEVGLIDLPMSGGGFTCCSNRESPVFCRLDRFLLSADLLGMLPEFSLKVGMCSISDHKPILLCRDIHNRDPKPFRWFDHWADEEEYELVVKEAVRAAEGKGIGCFLEQCQIESKKWVNGRKSKQGEDSVSVEKKLIELESKIQKGIVDNGAIAELKMLRAKLWN
ncbi:hypothetical protein HRI_000078100 [Hibiscus trionum]|uniref:Endonuclease/exonuclease/phosphatase domain-containing protein n=1 Tax=Hibiscus trionum TaxID=183268 RepID=A0A9W7GTI0_HIBTR|nr:hypothetical protein HRI_000078100 [Hibiscus trionum]